jgi:hypothetical protein
VLDGWWREGYNGRTLAIGKDIDYANAKNKMRLTAEYL